MSALIDLSGRKFGRLTVVRRSGTYRAPSGTRSRPLWLCVCGCNSPTGIVEVNGADLRSGHTTSCGCAHLERSRELGLHNTRHGHAAGNRMSPEYHSWTSMLTRCTNPVSADFKRYGGRGISVCERWRKFEFFLADMGERPAGKTLDRFPDNDGNYEPGNCRWATAKEQRANRRDSRQSVAA